MRNSNGRVLSSARMSKTNAKQTENMVISILHYSVVATSHVWPSKLFPCRKKVSTQSINIYQHCFSLSNLKHLTQYKTTTNAPVDQLIFYIPNVSNEIILIIYLNKMETMSHQIFIKTLRISIPGIYYFLSICNTCQYFR